MEADTDKAASARRYSFAEESRSEYAVSEEARSDLESTACGRWGGGGGRGRLNEDGIGLAVLAYEKEGEPGIGGRALGVGDGGRSSKGAVMVGRVFVYL